VSKRRRKPSRPVGGGGARNEASLSNLRRGGPITPMNALRHGGYASVAVEALDAKAKTVFAALSADAPMRDEQGDLPRYDTVAVRLLADCLCRLDSLSAWLAGRWATTEASPALDLERRLRDQALDLCEALGMTPRSRARLGLDVKRAQSFDLAAAWAAQGDAAEVIDDAEVGDDDDAA
jgi:hypothetical protein